MSKRTKSAGTATQSVEGESFPAGEFWVGRHSGDHDILVLDPEVSSPAAPVVALYSLSQHRLRTFPRATVAQKIQPLNGTEERQKAIDDYNSRNSLKAAFDDSQSVARDQRRSRQRQEVVNAHERYLSRMGLPNKGVTETGPDHKPGRRVKCHSCGIALDDFAGVVCSGCSGVLCSCGACACGVTPARR